MRFVQAYKLEFIMRKLKDKTTFIYERIFYMGNESLKRKVLNDMNMKENMISDLQRELKEEMNKPSDKWDCEKINEITQTIHNLSCDNENEEINSGKENLLKKIKVTKKPRRKIYRTISAVAACLIVGVALNTISISVCGMNMFSAVYEITQGGIKIDLNKKEDVIELPTAPDDPYGMKTKCAEYDIYPLTPSYIPEEFELINFEKDINGAFDTVIFRYKKDDTKLNFEICKYNDAENIPPIGIPTDTYNIEEQEINGNTMYILKEDNQFTATFQENDIVYVIFADGLNYDECQKVVESLVE